MALWLWNSRIENAFVNANPYQPPQTPPEPNPVRRTIVLTILVLLAVPAAGIAGGSMCTGLLVLAPQLGPLPFLAGFVLLVALLYGLHYSCANDTKALHGWGILGLALATPIALVAGGLISHRTIVPFQLPYGLTDAHYYLAAGCAAFTIWGIGFWLGLSGKLRDSGIWFGK